MDAQYVLSTDCAMAANNPSQRLASLFDVHYDRLYRLARRLAPASDDALDLVQETFLKAARFPKSIPVGVREQEAWLVRVLINIQHDHWRKKSVRNRIDRSQRKAANLSNPETALLAKTAVWQALDSLPPRRRAILVMYELEGLPIPAIASLLGISAITVRWHLSVGRRDLRRVLKPRIGDVE
jgi:RNA polymerase sigma-70 factor (ECF subfamily)